MKSIPKWEILELVFKSSGNYTNPFTDVTLQAVFQNKQHTLELDGFYDGMEEGKHCWRIRFAPMHEGIWEYSTISNIAELDAKVGTFECTQPLSRGGLTIHPQFSNWFAREDGSPQMVINEGWYPHPGNGKELSHEDVDFQQPSEKDMMLYIDLLSEHRVNLVIDIGQLYARQTSITDISFRWPWKVIDADNNKIDKDFFNLDFYQRMDRMLSYAKEREVFFAMELLYDNSIVRPREWSKHPMNKANGGWLEDNGNGIGWNVMFDLDNEEHMRYITRYIRYTVARFSAFWNVCWSVGSENGNLIRLPHHILPHALFSADITANWYNYWGDYVARRDPHHRLKTYGDAGKQPLMVSHTHNNFITTQDPRNYPRDHISHYYQAMNAFGEEFWSFGRPTVIGEMTAGTNNQYDVERRLYWIGLTSGYHMGRADRHFGPVVNGVFVESEKFNSGATPPIYADLRRMADFIESRQIRFWRMSPSDELISTGDNMIYCLASQDEEYILYYVYGGTATIQLPHVQYEWFNPRTGESFSKGALNAGTATLQAPDDDDWVLYMKIQRNH